MLAKNSTIQRLFRIGKKKYHQKINTPGKERRVWKSCVSIT